MVMVYDCDRGDGRDGDDGRGTTITALTTFQSQLGTLGCVTATFSELVLAMTY